MDKIVDEKGDVMQHTVLGGVLKHRPGHPNVQSALCAAQAEMGKVVKGSTNPAFKSKYADLADVVSAVSGPLSANGIAFYHQVVGDGDPWFMRTVLYHGKSDTLITCDVPLVVSKHDMQGFKSATTYAKRIGLESLTGVAPEDDDGNAAAKAAPSATELVAAIRQELTRIGDVALSAQVETEVEKAGGSIVKLEKFLKGLRAR